MLWLIKFVLSEKNIGKNSGPMSEVKIMQLCSPLTFLNKLPFSKILLTLEIIAVIRFI